LVSTNALRHAVGSHPGTRLEVNGDSVYAGDRLLAIADGGGDRVGSRVASEAAVAAMRELEAGLAGGLPEWESENSVLDRLEETNALTNRLKGAFAAADARLRELLAAEPELKGMSTGLTALLWWGDRIVLASVGGSRVYRLRDGELRQISADPDALRSLLEENRIPLEDVGFAEYATSLDGASSALPYVASQESHPGDRYLLCSDGVAEVVSSEGIHQVLAGQGAPEAAVERLISLALAENAPDNLTCIVADVLPEG
jgi:serine/threonine protein phosphatase PrpC